jgi:hypothetical protein
MGKAMGNTTFGSGEFGATLEQMTKDAQARVDAGMRLSESEAMKIAQQATELQRAIKRLLAGVDLDPENKP